MSSIITQIWTKVVTEFRVAEQWIEGAVAKIDAVLPGVGTAMQSDAKQWASDALGVVDATVVTYEPALVKGAEALVDSAIATATGGMALPLVGATNAALDDIGAKAQAAIHARILQAKAQLAENNAKMGGGLQPVSPPPPPNPQPAKVQ